MTAELSTPELAALSGASERQIDYWCRLGRLTPSRIDSGWATTESPGSGSRRKFDRSHVKVALVLADVMQLCGGRRPSTPGIATLTAELEDRRCDSWTGGWISVPVSPHTSIMVDLESAEIEADRKLLNHRRAAEAYR